MPLILNKTTKMPLGTTSPSGAYLGAKQTSGIQLVGSWDGDWSKPLPGNGFLFAGPADVALVGFTVRGFQGGGAAIKYDGTGRFTMDNLSIMDCSTEVHTPKRSPVVDASDVWYGHAFSSHGVATGIGIRGCVFKRCATNQWDYSHVLYCSAPLLEIIGNTFDGCGNPLSLGNKPGLSGRIEVLLNHFLNPAVSPNKYGQPQAAYFTALGPDDQVTLMRNRLDGRWSYPYTGHPRPGQHIIDYNNYSRMTYSGHWAADTGTGQTFTYDEWLKMGFDTHSLPPTKVSS